MRTATAARVPLAARLQPGDLVRIRDQRWRVERLAAFDDATLIDVSGSEPGIRHQRTTFVLAAEAVERIPAQPEPLVVGISRWRAIARAALADSSPTHASLKTLARSRVTIMPFQLEPAMAVTSGLADRLLIADDVGLGKTIQAGLIVAEVLERMPRGRALVVAPAALRDQWKVELESRFGLNATVIDRAAFARLGAAGADGVNPWASCAVTIASSDFVKRPEVIRALEGLIWDVLVLDEAHGLAGVSDRSRAARSLAGRSRAVVMLSATPHSGDDVAFERLCDLGRLKGSPPLVTFRRTRQDAGSRTTRRSCWLRVRLSDAELGVHADLLRYARLVCRSRDAGTTGRLAMMVLLKRACSGPAALARSLRRRIELMQLSEPSAELQAGLPFDDGDAGDDEPGSLLGAPGLSDRSEELERLADLLALTTRAGAHDSKLLALCRLLRRLAEPALVFTEYRDTLQHLAVALGCDAVLHGGLTSRERHETLAGFTSGTTPLLLATDAASEGINLHHRCRAVVNVELPWTPARLEQRIGRVDRMGQRSRVHAVHLVGRDTSEEDIVERLIRRASRAASAFGPSRTDVEIERALAGIKGDDPPPPREAHGMRVLSLAREAEAEAERARVSRALRGEHRENGGRPVVTSARRGKRAITRLLWGVRLTFVDQSGHAAWSTSIGIEALIRARPVTNAESLRELIETHSATVIAAVAPSQSLILAGAQPSLRRYVATGIAREHSIAAGLAQSGARLAAIQPGLFDRRADRLGASQRAILDDVLNRCNERLTFLRRLERASEGPVDIVFALARG